MVVINDVNSQKFTFNGIEYFKNFTPVVIGDKVRILNAYDSAIELTSNPTLFSDFVVDGNNFLTVADLQTALLPVLYTRSTLGSWSDVKEVIEGYFNGTNFYTDSGFTNLITPESGKIYINIAVTPATQYRWSGSTYMQIRGIQGVFLGSVTPTDIPTGTGEAFWIATENGTYTNFGGVVVNANSYAFISRDASGNFSISQTALDLTDYTKKYDNQVTQTLNIINNTYVSGTGVTGTDANYEVTDFIAIEGVNNRVTVTTGMNFSFAPRIVAYDINKNFLSVISSYGSDLIDFEFIQPANCAFIRVNNLKSKGIAISVKTEVATIDTIKSVSDANNVKLQNTTLTPISPIALGFISNTTGLVRPSTQYNYAFFNVVPKDKLYITTKAIAGLVGVIVYYDRYEKVISSVIPSATYNNTLVIIPSECYKIGLSNRIADGLTIKVVRDTTNYFSAQTIDNNDQKLKDTKDFDFFYKMAKAKSYNTDIDHIGLIVGGQSQFDGRIPNADFPTSWTDGSTYTYNKSLPNCKYNWNNRNGVVSNYNLGVSAWGADALIYNKVSQYLNGADFTVVKRTLGATSIKNIYPTSFNADIKAIEANSGWTSQLLEWRYAIENAISLNPSIKYKAILWMQGESDGENFNPQYFRDLGRVIAYLRGVTNDPSLPFIFGSVASNSPQYNANIYNDMVKISLNVNDTYFIDLGTKTFLPDGIHYDAPSSEIIATSFFNVLKNNYLLRRV